MRQFDEYYRLAERLNNAGRNFKNSVDLANQCPADSLQIELVKHVLELHYKEYLEAKAAFELEDKKSVERKDPWWRW